MVVLQVAVVVEQAQLGQTEQWAKVLQEALVYHPLLVVHL
jgi:hypothetical protein